MKVVTITKDHHMFKSIKWAIKPLGEFDEEKYRLLECKENSIIGCSKKRIHKINQGYHLLDGLYKVNENSRSNIVLERLYGHNEDRYPKSDFLFDEVDTIHEVDFNMKEKTNKLYLEYSVIVKLLSDGKTINYNSVKDLGRFNYDVYIKENIVIFKSDYKDAAIMNEFLK